MDVKRRYTSGTNATQAEIIAAQLRSILAKGRHKAGDRFLSQNEVARTFKTSTVTAREAALLLVREGLLERRFGSGTYVTGREPERFVAVVTELDISNPAVSPAFLTMLQSTRRNLEAAGIQTRVYIGHTRPFVDPPPERITSWDFWHDLEAGRTIGLVTLGMDEYIGLQAVKGRGIPFVDSSGCDGMPYWDAHELAIKGAEALAAHGCRRVGCVWPRDGILHPVAERFESEALRCGLVTRREWFVGAPLLRKNGDAEAVVDALWSRGTDKPDGLLVLDDMLYRDLAPALLLKRIRVPQDLVVASHANVNDNRPMMPEPIRLQADMEAVGAAMAQTMVNRLRDPDTPTHGIPVPVRVLNAPKGAS